MQKLAVGLRLCPNLADEFLEPRFYKRWHAEPLCSFCIETSIFTSSGQYGKCMLPPYVLQCYVPFFLFIGKSHY